MKLKATKNELKRLLEELKEQLGIKKEQVIGGTINIEVDDLDSKEEAIILMEYEAFYRGAKTMCGKAYKYEMEKMIEEIKEEVFGNE